MKPLKEIIKEAESNKIAVGHFNVSDLAGLKAVFSAAKELKLPVIIGVSEGEREFIGVKQIAALVKSLREEFDYPIYLNADHTHSLEKAKEAAEAGFDAIVFDLSKLPIEENIRQTKEAVKLIKILNPQILIEGEIGYIGSGSVLMKEIPEGAAVKKEDFTKPEEAERFVKETGVDLLAPAVGNIHGIIALINTDFTRTKTEILHESVFVAGNPPLDIQRIVEIRKAAGVPLVLHGGSGIPDEELSPAIDAGISIVHINTELRMAWRRGIEKALREKPEEITPYKILPSAVDEIGMVVGQKLRVFNKIK